jgi:hypothetical protein
MWNMTFEKSLKMFPTDKPTRTIKRKRGSDWETIRLFELENGDTFIMFDGDTQVGGEWVAQSKPYFNDGVWGIHAKEAK